MLPKVLTNDIGKMILVYDDTDDYKTILPLGEYILHPDFLDTQLSTIIDIYSISNAFIVQTHTNLYILSEIEPIKEDFTGVVYRVLNDSFIVKENDTYSLYDKYGINKDFNINMSYNHWFSGDCCIVKMDSSYLFYKTPTSIRYDISDEICIRYRLDVPEEDYRICEQGLKKDNMYKLSMRDVVHIYSITQGLFLLQTRDLQYHFFDKNIVELSSNRSGLPLSSPSENNTINLDVDRYYSLYATLFIACYNNDNYNNNKYTISFSYDPSYINLVTAGHILIVNHDKTSILNLIPNYPKDGIATDLCLSVAAYIQKIIYANQAIYTNKMLITNILTFDTLNLIQDNKNNIYVLSLIDTPIDRVTTDMIYNFQKYTEYKLEDVNTIFSVDMGLFLETTSGEYNMIAFPIITTAYNHTNLVNWTYSANKSHDNKILSKYFTMDDSEYKCIKKLCNIKESDNNKFYTLLTSFANNNSLSYNTVEKKISSLLIAEKPTDFALILSDSGSNSRLIILGITFIFVCFLCFR